MKNRVESHLFNEKYKQNGKKGNYENCMKLEKDSNGEYKQGINIDDCKYDEISFYVIQHKMNDSKQFMREAMEKAFDDIYNKPIACRD